jgi:hypothetical protein
MLDPHTGRREALSTWQASMLRLTAFPVVGSRISPEVYWSEMVGVPPDDVTSRPKSGQHQQTGIFEGRRLVLNIQPDRLDWVVTPAMEPSEEPESMPTAGSFAEAYASFERLSLSWLGIAPPITRLAFGAVLIQPVHDRRTGYMEIAKYLPSVKLDPEGSSDFLYQINRPRNALTPFRGLRINRLTKWSVAFFGRFNVDLGKTEITSKGYLFQECACRLELDINTVPEFTEELSKDHVGALFHELVALAKEIADKGDVP